MAMFIFPLTALKLKKKKIYFKYITFIYWLTPAPYQLPKTVLFLFFLLAMNALKLHYWTLIAHALINA